MLSEETYNNMVENIYVTGTRSNYDWLMESKAQLEKGMTSMHDLTQVEDDE
jgi:antitoxin YefM